MNRSSIASTLRSPRWPLARCRAASAPRRWCSAPKAAPKTSTPASTRPAPRSTPTSQIYNRIVEFERGGTKVVPGLAESWDISPDGKVYTFYLRKGVKWHNHRAFKPTRDFNADDVIFAFERQWKEDNPYFKVTSSNHSYFNDMGMPKLLKSVEKVDDYTVRITLNKPEAPFLSEPGDALRGRPVEGIRRRDAQGRHAREDRPGADRHRPVLPGAVPEGRRDPLQGVPAVLGRQGQDRRPRVRDHARCIGALGQAAEGRVPRHAVPEPGRPGGDPQGPERAGAGAARPERRLPGLQHARRSRSTTCACARPSTWRSTRRPSSTACTWAPAWRPRTRCRRRMWSYNDAIKDDPYDPAAAKKLLAEAGHPERLRRPTCGRCRCSARTTPTPSASPS